MQTLDAKFMQLGISEGDTVLASIEVKATFFEEMKDEEFEDEYLKELKDKMENCKAKETKLDVDGAIMVKNKDFVPRVDGLIKKLFSESHGSRYSIHYRICGEVPEFSSSEI